MYVFGFLLLYVPGLWYASATALNDYKGTKPVAQGAAVIVKYVTS